MEISIHIHNSVEIKLEVGYFDAVADIKSKIQTLTGVVSSRQALFLNKTLLHDGWDVARCNLFDQSHINLGVRNPVVTVFAPDQITVSILVRSPISRRYELVELGLRNRVEEVRRRIGEREKIPSSLLKLFLRGRELDDQRLVMECEGIERDDSVIEVGLVGSGGHVIDYAVAKVIVFLSPVNVRVPMTLNLLTTFSYLRKQLERLKKENRISLPTDWFFVFRKERVLIESIPFGKFKVQNGDVLQVWTTGKVAQRQAEDPPATINVEDSFSPGPSPKVQIRLKMPRPMSPISIQMSQNDTFAKLKEKIHDMEQIPANQVILHFNNKVVPDKISVREFDGKEVGVSVKQSPSGSVGSGASQGSKRRLRLTLKALTEPRQIQMELNAGDTVVDLRKELVRLQERMGYDLPAEYFFIFKQNIMEENQSLRWHGVGQGDLIEIFGGTVTGGN